MKKFKENLLYYSIILFSVLLTLGASVLMNPTVRKSILNNAKDYNAMSSDGTPIRSKSLKENGDGTYVISLDVTGDSEKVVNKANVIIIMDTSNSMSSNTTTSRIEYTYDANTVSHYNFYNAQTGNTRVYYRNGAFRTANNDNGQVYTGTVWAQPTANTRIAAEQAALDKMVTDLLSNNSTAYPDIIEISVVSYNLNPKLEISNSSNASDIKRAIYAVTQAQGTNWEMGFRRAIQEANSLKESESDEPVYIIFLTDGEPTAKEGSTGYDTQYYTNWSAASDEATSAANINGTANGLYTIFTYGNQARYVNFLDNLTRYAYGDTTINSDTYDDENLPRHPKFFDASDTTALIAAFQQIAEEINTSGIGAVSVSDGTTTAVQASSGSVSGGLLEVETNSFKYYLSFPITTSGSTITSGVEYVTSIELVSGDTYKLKDKDGNEYTVTRVPAYATDPKTGRETTTVINNVFKFEWTNGNNPLHQSTPPRATYDSDPNSATYGAVDWDLSSLNVLLNDVTYTYSFECYPSQVTLDLIADIKNNPDSYETLDSNIKQYLTSTGTLKTNTTATLKYDDTRTEAQEAAVTIPNPDPVQASTVSILSVAKNWVGGDPEEELNLNVDRDNDIAQYTVVLHHDEDPEKNYRGAINASIGIAKLDSNGNVTLLTEGHDYKFSEGVDLSYKWELTSPIVRPLMINGSIKTLILDTKNTPSMTSDHQTLTVDGESREYYRLQITVGKNEDGTPKKETKYYYVGADNAILTATNVQRSHLDFTKEVTGQDAANAPADSLFTYDVTITTTTGEDYWFSIRDTATKQTVANGTTEETTYVTGAADKVKEEVKTFDSTPLNITNVTVDETNKKITYKETDSETGETEDKEISFVSYSEENGIYTYKTGFYSVKSGATVTIKIQKGWNVRFTYLPTLSEYTITETSMDSAYKFDGVAITIDGAEPTQANQPANRTVSGQTVNGKLEKASVAYKETFTNEYALTHIDVTKIWNDNNNQDGIRPESVDITFNDGKDYNETITLDGEADEDGEITAWVARFERVPALDDDGNEITYTDDNITETDTPSFGAHEAIITGTDGPRTYSYAIVNKKDAATNTTIPNEFELTNTHTPEQVTIKVTKVWDDEDDQDGIRPDDVEVGLYIGDSIAKDATGADLKETLDEDNSWSTSWTVDKYAEGEEIEYTIKETTTSVINGTDGAGTYSFNVANKKDNEGNDIAYEYVVTNTHTPEQVTVTVTKVWDDNNDQDGIRPDDVEVGLYIGNTIVKDDTNKDLKETLDEDNSWSTSWTVDKYADGEAVEYTVKETTTSVINGTDGAGTYSFNVANKKDNEGNNIAYEYVVTNTHTPETIDIPVEKTWSGDNNDADLTRTSVNVTLTGTTTAGYSESYNYTLTSKEEWKHTFEGLPAYNNGNEITYAVTEEAVPGYDGAVSGYTITNTMRTVDVTITKVWDDNKNQDGIRPTSITLNLMVEGRTEPFRTVTINAPSTTNNTAESWTYTFEKLPEVIDGKKAVYTVDEPNANVPTNYERTAQSGLSVTNTHKPGETTITVKKHWDDNNDQDDVRPDEVEFQLYAGTEKAKYADGKEVPVIKLSGNTNDWSYTYSGLPEKANGETITYTVKEEKVAELKELGYGEPSYSTDGLEVTNSRTPDQIEITVTKVWEDNKNQDGIQPGSVEVTLYAGDEPAKDADGNVLKVELNSNNSWKHTWTVDQKAEKQDIVYSVVETTTNVITGTDGVGTYAISYSGTVSGQTGTITVTNTHTPVKDKITVTKVWDDEDDQDGVRPESVKFIVTGSDKKTYEVTLNGTEDTWTADVEVDKYTNGGKEVTFTVTEEEVNDGDLEAYDEPSIDNEKLTITNSYEPVKDKITVTKEWVDGSNQDGIRPSSVKFIVTGSDGNTYEKTLTGKGDTWTAEVEVQKYYDGGKDVTFTVAEEAVEEGDLDDYTPSIDNENLIITNSYTPDTVDISVTKAWSDASDKDGIQPDSVEVTLYANGIKSTDEDATVTLDESNKWTYTWSGLDKNSNAEAIEYSVVETKTDVITGTDGAGTYAIAYSGTVSGKSGSITVTNTHTPETISVTVNKEWKDTNNQDGIQPAFVKVNLLANGTVIYSDVVIQATDKWTYKFDGLDKYADGEEITYTVEEVTDGKLMTGVDGPGTYAIDNGGSVKGKSGSITVTNTHTPEKTEVVVTKEWIDENNRDGKRPEDITIKLFADGKEVKNPTVTKEVVDKNNWKYTFSQLPKYADGEEIEYTITEEEVKGYKGTVNGFAIKNEHPIEKIESISGEKTWVDGNDQDGLRPASVTIKLLADGEVVKTATVTPDKNGKWLYTFNDLPVYKAGAVGEEIEYTIAEPEVPEGYTSKVEDYNVVNTHSPSTKSISGTKKWNDNDDQDGIRPEFIIVNLIADGKPALDKDGKAITKKVTATDNWAYTFENLPEYSKGNLISYSVTEEAIPSDEERGGYSVEYETKAATETTPAEYNIINTHSPAQTSIEGHKDWDDKDDQDGIRPESITVNLLADGKPALDKDGKAITKEVTAGTDGKWTYVFDNLPTYNAGKKIVYTLEEVSVEGYSTKITDFEIVNTHETETVKFTVTKDWEDESNNDGIRPSSIKVNLLANGEVIDTVTVKPNAEGEWSYTFGPLDKNKGGEPIDYTVSEDVPAGYTFSKKDAVIKDNVITQVIVNTHETTKISINGTKTWVGDDTNPSARPEFITIIVYADGVEINRITVTADSDWKYGLDNLYKFKNGQEITYTIDEVDVKDYEKEVNGFNVTNHYTEVKGENPPPTKVDYYIIINVLVAVVSGLGIYFKREA